MSALDALLDHESFSLELAADALGSDDPNIDLEATLGRLLDLCMRFPGGLIHARSIGILSERPVGLEALAEGSPWYAVEDRVIVVVRRKKSAVRKLVADLAMYFILADRYGAALSRRADLVEALALPALTPEVATELALALDAPPSLVMQLDRRVPTLRADLAAMAPRMFSPDVRIHASLRTPHMRVQGARVGRDLLGRLPQGTIRLLICDSPAALEHLSPYARDLGFALSTWGLENEEQLSTPGLADALRESSDRASVDLASLVVPDLFASAPELLLERREAEVTAGLFLADDADVVSGFAELSRLAQPDETAIARESSGTLAVLASPSEPLLVEAAGELIDSGRVSAISIVLAASIDAPGIIVFDALANEHDGTAIARANELAERATKLSIELHRPGCLTVDDERGAPALAFDLVARTRRARALGRLSEEVPVYPVLYPTARGGAFQSLTQKLRELEAGRVALSLLSSQEDPPTVARTRRGTLQNAPGLPRRFRA
jgi:hypothetical protein